MISVEPSPRAEGTVRAREDALRAIVDALGDALVVLDENYCIVQVNRAAAALCGRSEGELIGKWVWDRVPDRTAAALERVRKSGRPEVIEEYLAPLGRWLENRLVPFGSGVAMLARDVTERRRLTALERQRHADEQARTEVELERVAYLALREPALRDDLLVYLAVTREGREPRPVEAGQALVDALADLAGKLEATRAEVQADPLPVVMADAAQLQQLFERLIASAIERRGEAPPRVRITVEHQGGERCILVADLGVAPEEPVFAVDKHLGLAICRRIVERHGGRIWVESQTRLKFTLPGISA